MIELALALMTTPDPLSPLTAYSGGWKVEIERFDTEFSKAGKVSNRLTNRCQQTRKFFACAQTVDGEEKALVVFTAGEAPGEYVTYPIAAGGGPAGKGRMVITGEHQDTWTYPWDQQKDGTTVHFRVVNVFQGRDRIEYRQEFSRDGSAWTVTERGVETRDVRPPG